MARTASCRGTSQCGLGRSCRRLSRPVLLPAQLSRLLLFSFRLHIFVLIGSARRWRLFFAARRVSRCSDVVARRTPVQLHSKQDPVHYFYKSCITRGDRERERCLKPLVSHTTCSKWSSSSLPNNRHKGQLPEKQVQVECLTITHRKPNISNSNRSDMKR